MAQNLDPLTDRNIEYKADSFFQATVTYKIGLNLSREYLVKTGKMAPNDLFGMGTNSHYIRDFGAQLAAEGRRLGCPVGNIEAIAANPLFATDEQVKAAYLECPRIAVAFKADAAAHQKTFPKLNPYPIKVYSAWWGIDVRWADVTKRIQFILDNRIDALVNLDDLKNDPSEPSNDPAHGMVKFLRINFDRGHHVIINERSPIFSNDNSIHTNICRQFPFIHRFKETPEVPNPVVDQPQVVLLGRGKGASVNNIVKSLTSKQYDVINALINAPPLGLTKDTIENIHPSARDMLTRLSHDADWSQVIHMAGVSGHRYRID